jgi:hypothetical protein
MYSGIIGSPKVAWLDPAAENDPMAPASVMPSCRIWPLVSSL